MDAAARDLELLASWQGGDLRAGQALFARHFSDVYRFFEHKVGPDADDLTQKTFMSCVGARDRFRGQSTFRTYLFAIARNELYTYLRRRPKAEHVDFEVTSIAEVVTSVGSRMAKAREVEQLRAALEQLPAEQQLLLELHYWHDLDAAGLAEVFESNAGAIRVRLLRARKALREQMDAAAPGFLSRHGADPLSRSLSDADLDSAGGE